MFLPLLGRSLHILSVCFALLALMIEYTHSQE